MKVNDKSPEGQIRQEQINTQKRLQQLKKINEQQIYEAKERADQLLQKANEQNGIRLQKSGILYEEQMGQLGKTLQDAKKQLEQERLDLDQRQQEIIETERDKFNERYNQQQELFNNYINDYTEKTSASSRELASNQQQQLFQNNQTYKSLSAMNVAENQQKLDAQKTEFKKKSSMSEINFQKDLKNQEKKEKISLETQNKKHIEKMNQLDLLHASEFQAQQNIFQAKIKEAYKNFEEKYQRIVASHKETLGNLQHLAQKSIQETKKNASATKDLYMERTSDPFYRMNTLDYEIIDTGKHYDLKISLPEHEKEFLSLAGKDRSLRLTYSRGFQDEFKDAENLSKYSKVESYNQEFFVPEIVNMKKVTKSYENGNIIFKIPKA